MRQKSGHAESPSERIVREIRRSTRKHHSAEEKIRIVLDQLALDEPELSSRELAAHFADTANYFVSEASVYRLLKSRNLITSPAYIVMKGGRITASAPAVNRLRR